MSKEIEGKEYIKTKKELNQFLNNIKDKLAEDGAAPVYALSAINGVLSQDNIYDLLDSKNKELARDIWLRIKKAGFQLEDPPLLDLQ